MVNNEELATGHVRNIPALSRVTLDNNATCIFTPSMGNNRNLSEGEKEKDDILIEKEG